VRFQVIVKFFGLLLIVLSGQQNLVANYPDIALKRYEIDSLLTLLPRASQAEKIDLLLDISKTYMTFSMDSSMEYARLALKNAKNQRYPDKIAKSYKMLGNISFYMGNYNGVIHFYDSSLRQYELANDIAGQSKVWNNLGIVYNNLGDYASSIKYHLMSKEYKIQIADSIGIANSYNNIGSIYFSLEDYTNSFDYFKKAQLIYERIGKEKGLYKIYNNLGLISNELGHYDKAIEYYNMAMEASEKENNTLLTADIMNNMGLSNVNMGNYIEGLEWYKRAFDIYDQLGVKKSLLLNNMGQAYLELDYYNHALSYLKEALEIEKKQGQLWLLRDIYYNISITNKRMGQFENAFSNYVLYSQYSDSVKNNQYNSRIEEITAQYNIEKSQEQIVKTQLENENKELELRKSNLINYFMIGGMIITLVFVVILFRLLKLKGNANKKLVAKNDEIMRSQEIIKRINKALTESEEKLRSIFDVSPYAIFVLDSDFNIIDCNDTSIQFFRAHNKRDLLDKNINDFVSEENTKSLKQKLGELADASSIDNVELVLKRNDISAFQASISGRLIKDVAARKDAFVIVINDVTERLHIIENLKEAKVKAEESDRLKTAFLANMSHEIRTPMNSIIGFSNLLSDPEIEIARRQEFINHILTSSNILLNLIEDIIDISKIEAGQMSLHRKKVKVNKLLQEIFKSYEQSNTNPEINFHLILPEKSENVECHIDPIRLGQVLNNLLSNAIKFTSSGSIDMGYSLQHSDIGTKIKFFVRDTGIGIPKDKQDLIFDRFRQVDDSQSRKYGGTGLGLAISKRLTEIMGGSIWVDSEEGEGATFYVKLFCSSEIKKAVVLEGLSESKYNWQGKTILLAEDENSNYQLVKATISQTGVNLIRVKNGKQAVDMVLNDPNIDLILMDIRMPEMNGYDATHEIKSIDKTIPVIAITAYAMTEDESKSIKAGCDEYLSKPIKPAKLLGILDGYLKKA
jgi:PAS domain S-box-containing protein